MACLILIGTAALAATPSNPRANATTRALYDYLAGLPQRSEGKLLSGQHMGLTTAYSASNMTVAYGYKHFVTPLVSRTGRHVAMVGADYGPIDATVSFPIDYAAVNAPLLQHWRDGGLVTVMYSARNPWNGKNANDRTFAGPLSDLLRPGAAANAAWMAQLDSVAAGLAALRAAGVVVLFRPLHEINGAWFWWGYNPANSAYRDEIIAVWRHMHDYFSNTKGLDNLLWIYNVTPKGSGAIPSETSLYPGDAYVDVLSFDIYATAFDSATVAAYNALKALGKPVALAEFGPTNRQWAGTFDYTLLLAEIRSKTPDLVYFQVWSDYGSEQTGYALLSLASNVNADKVLNDALVVTTENLPFGARSAAPTVQDCLFDWAETAYPSDLMPRGVASQSVAPYYLRYYSQSRAYLGTSSEDGHVYYLGPLSGDRILDLGAVSTWYAAAGCNQPATPST